MTQEEVRFVNHFQATIVAPIQRILLGQKYKNRENDLSYVTIKRTLCSVSVLPEPNGEFKLSYLLKINLMSGSYTVNSSTEHIESCLLELLSLLKSYRELYKKSYKCSHTYLYKELYEPKDISEEREFDYLEQGIGKLLQIVNSSRYGEFYPS